MSIANLYSGLMSVRERGTDLASDGDLVVILIADRTPGLLSIWEDNGHSGLGHPSLSLLVNELLQIGHPHLLEIGDSHDEADRVQNIRLPGAIVPRNGVEKWVEIRDRRPRRIGLEPFQTYLLDKHRSSSHTRSPTSTTFLYVPLFQTPQQKELVPAQHS